ncbi:hypothetical protein LguiB_028521 [Lonicera macranthoides]
MSQILNVKFWFAAGGGDGGSVAAVEWMVVVVRVRGNEARNMSDISSWPNNDSGGGRRGDGGREGDHVSDVLLVASVACGATGVVLLIVTAFIFLIRNQKLNGKVKSSTPLALPPPPPRVLTLDV